MRPCLSAEENCAAIARAHDLARDRDRADAGEQAPTPALQSSQRSAVGGRRAILFRKGSAPCVMSRSLSKPLQLSWRPGASRVPRSEHPALASVCRRARICIRRPVWTHLARHMSSAGERSREICVLFRDSTPVAYEAYANQWLTISTLIPVASSSMRSTGLARARVSETAWFVLSPGMASNLSFI